MAACLADGRGEIAPTVGERTAEVLAREVRHYLDCHTRPRDGAENGPDLLHLHARKAGDAMTVAHALGKVLAKLPDADFDVDEPAAGRDLCFALDLSPPRSKRSFPGGFWPR